MRYWRLFAAVCRGIKRSFIVWKMNEAVSQGKEIYNCATCGMARTEPCEHWKQMIEPREE